MPALVVGVISDIHGRLSDKATEALQGCDFILCAGDVESPAVLMELECIAPTIAVRGNCDRVDLGPGVHFSAYPRFGGVRFNMVHRPEDIGVLQEDVRVVVHGHTHVPRNQVIDGVLFINPGSPTRPRGGSKKSVARLTIDAGEVSNVEFVSWD